MHNCISQVQIKNVPLRFGPSSKRKYSETSSVEAKITKTKDSITKLKRHIDNTRHAPSHCTDAAHTNIPPDVEFKDKIKAIKQTTQQAYLHALTKFHYRRVENRRLRQKEVGSLQLQRDKVLPNHIL